MATHVPITARRLRTAPAQGVGGHGRKPPGSREGSWVCELKAETPLCIKSYFEAAHRGGEPFYVPGSSLRGMARSVVEMMGAACGRFLPEGPGRSKLPPCSMWQTCLACRMFGFAQGDSTWRGKVSFSDTDRRACAVTKLPLPPVGGMPPPMPAGGGWRLFSHLPAPAGEGPLVCAAAGETFTFTVRYEDLSVEEYDVLKFALTLQKPGFAPALCHKLGYGKETGLGSCSIRIPADASPAISASIDGYLSDPAFAVFIAGRTY